MKNSGQVQEVWRVGTLSFHPQALSQPFLPIRLYHRVPYQPPLKRKNNMRRTVRVRVAPPDYCYPSPHKPDLVELRNAVAAGKLTLCGAIGAIKSWNLSAPIVEFMEEQVIPERSSSFTPPNHRPRDLDYYDKMKYEEPKKGRFNFEYYDAMNDFSTTPDETQGSPPQMSGAT